MIKIAIVDDHEIFLKGLEGLLIKEFSISQCFINADSFLKSLPELEIDVLLLDVQLPSSDPVSLLKEIRKAHPELPILYLTLMRGNRYFNKLQPHRIQGYVLKDSPIETLTTAIKTVASGQTYFSDRYSSEMEQNNVTIPKDRMISLLSKRELEVMKLVAQELSSAQIAERLFVSVSTVDSHRKNIMIKLGVDNIVGLVKIAVENGLV